MGQVPDAVRIFIESVPDPVICYDTSCHIAATNSKGRTQILRTFNDVSHLRACEITGESHSSKQCNACVYGKVKQNHQDFSVEGEIVLPDGQRKLFSRYVSLWSIKGNNILVEIWKDLSKEHSLCRDVELKNLIIDGFLELFDIPVFITDEHFRLVNINRFLEKFAKIPYSHLIGRSLWDVIKLSEQDTYGLTKVGQRVLLRARLSRDPEEECNISFTPLGTIVRLQDMLGSYSKSGNRAFQLIILITKWSISSKYAEKHPIKRHSRSSSLLLISLPGKDSLCRLTWS